MALALTGVYDEARRANETNAEWARRLNAIGYAARLAGDYGAGGRSRVILSSTASVLALLFAGLLVAAAVQDALTLRISNLLSVAVLVIAAVGLAVNSGLHWWQHLLSFVILLGFGALLFSLGWMGGGDAKLMAAAALAFDLAGMVRFCFFVVLAGGLIALLAIVLRTMLPARRRAAPRKGIPYGIAIAAGALATLLLFRGSSVFAG